jgi:hypothetical protein
MQGEVAKILPVIPHKPLFSDGKASGWSAFGS